jgi:hypothetical protein
VAAVAFGLDGVSCAKELIMVPVTDEREPTSVPALNFRDKRELPLVCLNVVDAAYACGVSRNAIFSALNSGALCGRKHGKSLIFEVRELERWVQTLPYRGRRPEACEACAEPREAVVRRSGGRKFKQHAEATA